MKKTRLLAVAGTVAAVGFVGAPAQAAIVDKGVVDETLDGSTTTTSDLATNEETTSRVQAITREFTISITTEDYLDGLTSYAERIRNLSAEARARIEATGDRVAGITGQGGTML